MNQKTDNPLTLAWNWLSEKIQEAFADSSKEIPLARFQSRKLTWLLTDKKRAARRLKENSEIKSHFIQDRQYVHEQLEQQCQWLTQQFNKSGDPARKQKIQKEIEAIQSDSLILLAQEKVVEAKFDAWKSAFFACEQPGKSYRHFGKEFAWIKEKFSKALKNHGDLDSCRLDMQQAKVHWEEAEQQLIRCTENARKLEKEFEQAAALAWPLWKSEAGSITTQMLEAA